MAHEYTLAFAGTWCGHWPHGTTKFTGSPVRQNAGGDGCLWKSGRPKQGAVMGWNPFARGSEEVLDLQVLQERGVPAVRVRDLHKSYRSKTKRALRPDGSRAQQVVKAVDGISFDVMAGQIFGLLGPNSCGKTTTMRCCCTLSKPDKGSVEIYGVDTVKEPYFVRKMVGFVAQSAGLDKVLTGREHLQLFAGLAHLDRETAKRNIDQLIEVLDLGDFIDRQTKVYSGGVSRRLDLAIGLLHQPPVLILDEPTVGLDAATREVIWSVLKTLRANGAAILLTSHYLEEVDILADSVAIMDHGVILGKGRVADLKLMIGGDRISVRLNEFTSLDEAERVASALVSAGVAMSATVNRLRANTIELVVSRDDPRIGRTVVEALEGLGHERLWGFAQSRPSLDDVYLAATGKKLEDADKEARQTRDAKAEQKESMI